MEETPDQSKIPDLILPHVKLTKEEENFYFTQTGWNIAWPGTTGGYNQMIIPTLYNAQGQNYTGTYNCISESCNLVQPGTASYQRKGREILVNRIELKAVVFNNQNIYVIPGGVEKTQGLISASNIIYIDIWLDTQYNEGVEFTLTNVNSYNTQMGNRMIEVPNAISDAPINIRSHLAFWNRATSQRFILLKHIDVTFNANTITRTGATSSVNTLPNTWNQGTPGNTPYQPNSQLYYLYCDIINIQIPIMFDDTQSAGTLPTIPSKNIFIMAGGYDQTCNGQIHHNTRITYQQIP